MVGYVINEDFPLTIKVELIPLHMAPPKLAVLLPNIYYFIISFNCDCRVIRN